MKNKQFKTIISNVITTGQVLSDFRSDLLKKDEVDVNENDLLIVENIEVNKTDLLKSLLNEVEKDIVNDLLIELGFISKKTEHVVTLSKNQLGILILDEIYSQQVILKREYILKRLQDELSIGQNYSSTMLQNYKKEKGLTNSK